MKNLRLKSLLLTLLALSLLALAGCGQESSDNTDALRLGYFPNITHAAAIVGAEQGIFQEELSTTKLETQTFPNGSLLMDAILTDQVDIGYVGPEPVINRYLQGADVVVLAGAASGGNVIVASRDSEVQSIKDLANKVVATPALGCTHDIEMRVLMDRAGLAMENDGGNVSHLTQKPALMMNLLQRNELDAASVSEPWASQMEEKTGAKVIVEWDEMPWDGNLPSTLLVAKKQFVKEHPELVKKILKAHVESVNKINSNLDDAADTVQQHITELTKSELSTEVITNSFTRTNITYKVDPKILNELVEESSKLGFFESTDVNGLVDKTLLNNVLENM